MIIHTKQTACTYHVCGRRVRDFGAEHHETAGGGGAIDDEKIASWKMTMHLLIKQ